MNTRRIPIVDVILEFTISKPNSESAIERGMWNAQSIQNFFDTFGLGVGLGSTRSSSWPISVLAQLGAIGGIGILITVIALARCVLHQPQSALGALAKSASAAAFGWIFGTVSAGPRRTRA